MMQSTPGRLSVGRSRSRHQRRGQNARLKIRRGFAHIPLSPAAYVSGLRWLLIISGFLCQIRVITDHLGLHMWLPNLGLWDDLHTDNANDNVIVMKLMIIRNGSYIGDRKSNGVFIWDKMAIMPYQPRRLPNSLHIIAQKFSFIVVLICWSTDRHAKHRNVTGIPLFCASGGFFVGWNWAHKTPDTIDRVAERNLFNFNVLLSSEVHKEAGASDDRVTSYLWVRQQHTILWRSDLGRDDDEEEEEDDNDNEDTW